MHPTLVVEPQFRFDQIDAALAELHWVRQTDTSVAPPLVPGEPEFAAWRRSNDASRVSYTFNPAVRLRVLLFRGPAAPQRCAEAGRRLPTLDADAIRDLLGSRDPRRALLGVFAAVELNLLALAPLLDSLRAHSEPAVARAAEQACTRLGTRVLELGAQRLAGEHAAHPDRSALFPRLGDARQRRQILRWLIHDYREANPEIVRTLRAALEDRDWEVRATAMIAAARWGLRELWPAVRAMRIPATTRAGPDRTDRAILLALRQAALHHLRTDVGPAQDHLGRCLLGQPVDLHDRVFLLVVALTEPQHAQGRPPALPAAVEAQGEAFLLRRSRLSLCWVDAVSHWLGADEELPSPNPVRRDTPASGFFISKVPAVAACSWTQALEYCERLSREESWGISVPSPEQWEMAVRGTDARRYPWGNGFEGDPTETLTPWGLAQVCATPTWILDTSGAAAWGLEQDYRCAAHASASHASSDLRCGLRLVLRPA